MKWIWQPCYKVLSAYCLQQYEAKGKWLSLRPFRKFVAGTWTECFKGTNCIMLTHLYSYSSVNCPWQFLDMSFWSPPCSETTKPYNLDIGQIYFWKQSKPIVITHTSQIMKCNEVTCVKMIWISVYILVHLVFRLGLLLHMRKKSCEQDMQT